MTDHSCRRLILVRHCQATGQAPDAPLTEDGRRQAQELAAFLRHDPIDCIVSSAFDRAVQTAEPLAASLGLTVSMDPRLNERLLSPRAIPNWMDVVRDSFDDWDLRAPHGESAREVLTRGWACLNELSDGRYRLPLAVTHGNLMSLLLHSIDADFGYAGWQNLTNPDVYVLRWLDGGVDFQRRWRG